MNIKHTPPKHASCSNGNLTAKPINSSYPKPVLIKQIANNTQLTRKQVDAVLTELKLTIERHLTSGSARKFTLPGLFEISVQSPTSNTIDKIAGGQSVSRDKKSGKNTLHIRPGKSLRNLL
ncbi:MAG: HU family DNA-binding protein [Porticoccaceae bacterium]|nr:HU family DNA-binding protein [Porticoccaceae bacterium]MDG1473400.1 HU family DNA-binding protein [Porticoccaceae bacterium]